MLESGRKDEKAPEVSQPMGNTTGAVSILKLLLRKTGKNGGTIALVFPDESADYVRGFVDGSTGALRLALAHVRDVEK
jgi:hypothetical protein